LGRIEALGLCSCIVFRQEPDATSWDDAQKRTLEMDTHRYAIYLAPEPHDPLWRFGSLVLGYDAASGEDTNAFVFNGCSPEEWRGLTNRARSYGFHATLKAPFRLADGISPEDLVASARTIAEGLTPIDFGKLALSILDEREGSGFLALTPTKALGALGRLERRIVMELDPLRAPLSPEETARRNPDALSERQRSYLENHGYPFVLKEFRMHFTLSDRLPMVADVAEHFEVAMRNQLGAPRFKAKALVIFQQTAPQERFRIMQRISFGETVT
jgi:hypothetical protein